MAVKVIQKVSDPQGLEPVANLLIEGQILSDGFGNLSIAVFRGSVLCSGPNIDSYADQIVSGFEALYVSVQPLNGGS